MTLIRLRPHKGLLLPSNYPVYDTRYGTDPRTAALTGWFTWGLRPGCRRTYVDNVTGQGNDLNSGYSLAARKATLNSGVAAFRTGYTPGDQLIILGGGAGYTDSFNDGLTNFDGYSNQFPMAVLGADPADPSNEALYGRVVGPKQPRILLDPAGSQVTQTFCSMAGQNINGRLAVAGLYFDTQGGTNCGLTYVGPHSHIILQNNRMGQAVYSNDSETGNGTAIGRHVSKCSFWGNNGTPIYMADVNDWWLSDINFIHSAWDFSADRTTTNGALGGSTFKHNVYAHATCGMGFFGRINSIDGNQEIGSIRCGARQQAIWGLDNPVGVSAGSFSSTYAERPNGMDQFVDDAFIAGSANVNPTIPGGWALSTTNTRPGSYARNFVCIDSPLKGLGQGYDRLVEATRGQPLTPDQYMLLDLWSSWAYADTALTPTSSAPNEHYEWRNSQTEMAVASLNATAASNCSVRGSAPASYKNRSQLLASLGSRYATGTYAQQKAALGNDLAYRPDLDWNSRLMEAGLATLGHTPTKTQTGVSLPDLTGTTVPAVYS